MEEKINPIRPTDDEARAEAQRLMREASFGAVAVLSPETGAPSVTRIAVLRAEDGAMTTLISDLSAHTKALKADPRASLLLGEPGPKGDPLTHPRITLSTEATFITRDDDRYMGLRAHWLEHRPKTKLYIDFGDFNFVRFAPLSADLNGGFGKAFQLTPEDLSL